MLKYPMVPYFAPVEVVEDKWELADPHQAHVLDGIERVMNIMAGAMDPGWTPQGKMGLGLPNPNRKDRSDVAERFNYADDQNRTAGIH